MKNYCTVQDLEHNQDELTEWRRTIHQNPELAFKETATARMVAEKLAAWGYAVTEGVGTTGVVFGIEGGSAHCAGFESRNPHRHACVNIDERQAWIW